MASVNAAPLNKDSTSRIKVAKKYIALKNKAERGEKVRVIAKVKEGNIGLPNSISRSKAIENVTKEFIKRGMTSRRKLPRLGMTVWEVDSSELDALIDSGLIESIVEDIAEPPSLVQSIEQVGANLAHNNGFTAVGQAVAILDTGVEFWHPFYADRLVEEACFSSDSDVSTTLCPNGLETEIGVNAANDCSATGIGSCDHGTHVAGIAAGIDSTRSGVAPGADIVAVQVFSLFSASYASCNGAPCILSYTSDQLAALEWVLNDAITPNIAAINMSIGGGEYTSPCSSDTRAGTIAALRNVGIATVISSGNDSYSDAVSAPGCIDEAITVGSTLDSSDSISWFSNSASMVDILAPGSFIDSSIVGGGFGQKSGTSMAAPHITGAFAVMRAINPNATVADIEQSLESNGVQVLDPDNNLTFPRIDLNASTLSFEGVPIASLDKESYSVIVNKETKFTAYSSSDPNSLPLTYTWDLGDGVSDYQTSLANINYTYSTSGSFNISLSVNNGEESSNFTDSALVTVYDPAIISVIVSSILL